MQAELRIPAAAGCLTARPQAIKAALCTHVLGRSLRGGCHEQEGLERTTSAPLADGAASDDGADSGSDGKPDRLRTQHSDSLLEDGPAVAALQPNIPVASPKRPKAEPASDTSGGQQGASGKVCPACMCRLCPACFPGLVRF